MQNAYKNSPHDEEALRAIDLLYDTALVSSGFTVSYYLSSTLNFHYNQFWLVCLQFTTIGQGSSLIGICCTIWYSCSNPPIMVQLKFLLSTLCSNPIKKPGSV